MAALQQIVIDTPELLENILFFLDTGTLLTSAQLVCRNWHDLITESPSLQQRLFFRPAPKNTAVRRNDLLETLFPPWFPSHGTADLRWVPEKDFDSLPLIEPDRNEAFRRKEASWRRMLPRQPPIYSMSVAQIFRGRDGFQSISTAIQRVIRSRCRTGPEDEPEYTNCYRHNPHAVFDDDYTIEDDGPTREPMRMEAFYRLIIDYWRGPYRRWLWIWDSEVGTSVIPEQIKYDTAGRAGFETLSASIRDCLESGLRKQGVVMIILSSPPRVGNRWKRDKGDWFDPRYKLEDNWVFPLIMYNEVYYPVEED